MADMRHITALDIAESLREVADQFNADGARNREKNHRQCRQCQQDDQAKWTVLGIVVAVVVMVVCVKLPKK